MKLINFIHIPKTAGTTFIHILHRNFPEDVRFQIDGMDPETSLKKLATLPLEKKEKVKLLLGHWSIRAEEFFNPDTAITRIIFFREPVRHFVSTYEYIKKTAI